MEDRYRWYRTEIPNLLDDSNLSPSAYRLYGHIKRVAGDKGVCRDSTRQMAVHCRMSIGMVSEARKDLLDRGLINVAGRGPHGLDIIEVTDVWPKNYEKYNQSSQYERCDTEIESLPDEQRSDSEQIDTQRSHCEQIEPQSSNSEHSEPSSVHIMNSKTKKSRTRSHYEHNKKELKNKLQLQPTANAVGEPSDDGPPAFPLPSNGKEPTENQKWFEAMCQIVYGHQDYGLLSKTDRMAIGTTVTAIRKSSENYTIPELWDWFEHKWSQEWPGKQKGTAEIQRPMLKQVKQGIGRMRAIQPLPAVESKGSANGSHQRSQSTTDESLDVYAGFT